MPPKRSVSAPIRDAQLHLLVFADERRRYGERAAAARVDLTTWIRTHLNRAADREERTAAKAKR